jgi:hypothetical protein
VTPLRLVALPGELTAGVENPEALLRNFDGQLTTGTPDVCRLSTRDGRSASVLLDFGKELCGGIALSAAIRADQRALKVRIRLGESVSEAMSDVGGDAPMASATNEHSLRDFTLGVPWLGNVEAGNSGFRFVRIDLVEPDAELNLKAVRAILRYRDVPYLGSFRCDDERLNRIWETGAYTVHLNMQEYLWDGVKRDRLVWLGDVAVTEDRPHGFQIELRIGLHQVDPHEAEPRVPGLDIAQPRHAERKIAQRMLVRGAGHRGVAADVAHRLAHRFAQADPHLQRPLVGAYRRRERDPAAQLLAEIEQHGSRAPVAGREAADIGRPGRQLPVEIPEQRFGIFHPRRQLAGQCDQPQRGHVPA